MIKHILNTYAKKYLSVWAILVFDLAIVFILYIFSFLLRYQFNLEIMTNPNYVLYIGWNGLILKAVAVLLVYGACFSYFKTYRGILRYTTIHEANLILKSCFIAVSTLLFFSIITYFFLNNYLIKHRNSVLYLPKIVSILHSLLVVSCLLTYRIIIKNLFLKHIKSQMINRVKVMIYGAGSYGMVVMNALKNDSTTRYDIIGFIDDDPNKTNKKIRQFTIFKPEIGFEKMADKRADQIIIAIQNLEISKKGEIIHKALELNIEIKNVPPINHWINGELTSNQIKSIKITDLLGRTPIRLNSKNVLGQVKTKTVLISGAAGSIGSEITRQLLHFEPKKIIAVDQAESFLYNLQTEIKINHPELFKLIDFIVADIKNADCIDKIFTKYNPDIIYHAAAYKHVPLMEEFPFEAFNTNIMGTKKLADFALANNCEKFVMVSTDKAVNPTSVMGATKRIAEIYIQSLQKKHCKTKFITTRFGNVLGSNGSVISIFKEQIEKKVPVTITHKNISRYFMTISEACNLVLEASAIGEGGEIFVFDMGKRVKIYDLAINMIKLYGAQPFKDIDIEEVGLRPGEKLYEELLSSTEEALPTDHPKILKSKVNGEDYTTVNKLILQMQNLSSEQEFKLIDCMKILVPNFRSNNSRFEKLDCVTQNLKN